MANTQDFILKNALEVGKDTKVTLGTITSGTVDLSTGNYFAETLAGDTTYTFSNSGSIQSFQVEVTGGLTGYSLSNASYDAKSFSFVSQDASVLGITLSTDGTKVYIAGNVNDAVFQYNLSVAWDISTASYSGNSVSISTFDTVIRDVKFNPDGTKMYILGLSSDNIYQYSMSTAWDISTASYDSVSFNVLAQDDNPLSLAFKSDGSKFYIFGGINDTVFQYTLSTSWDMTTASYDSVSYSVAGIDTGPEAAEFSVDGTKMYICGATLDNVYQYSLSTAWDVSTASYDSVSFNVTTQETSLRGISFGDNGTKFYVVGTGSNTAYQYTNGVDTQITWPTSVEWPSGVAPSSPASGETDVYTFVTDDAGTTYIGLQTADNLS